METKIINPFNKKLSSEQKFYNVSECDIVYSIGDYKIYKNNSVSWVYTYKNLAFNELAGVNIAHLNSVATRTEPTENISSKFLYQRAIETIEKNQKYIN